MNGHRGDRWLVAVGSLLAFLAYPPFNLIFPSFVALVPALFLIQRAAREDLPVSAALRNGFWYGVVSQSAIMSWVPVALWRLNHAAIVAFIPVLLMFGVYHALVFAFAGWARRSGTLPLAVAFPAAWTAMEWLLAHQGPLAMPWLGLGTSLTGFPVLIQVGDLIGARGLTFMLAAANVAVFVAICEPRKRARVSLALLAGSVVATGYGVFRLRNLNITVRGTAALIQPATGAVAAGDSTAWDSVVENLIRMSEREVSRARPDLIVWPETAVPDALDRHPPWLESIVSLARRRGSTVVSGVRDIDSSGVLLNSVRVFRGRRDSVGTDSYVKRFLVPLIERRSLWPWQQLGGFRPGQRAGVIETEIGSAGFLICFESAFEQAAREAKRSGAEFLINLNNDIWLSGTTGMAQHPAHLVMRAIENRIGIAVASNTGYTGFVDPSGRIYGLLTHRGKAVVSGSVLSAETTSVYSVLGDLAGPASLGIVLLAMVPGLRKPRMAWFPYLRRSAPR